MRMDGTAMISLSGAGAVEGVVTRDQKTEQIEMKTEKTKKRSTKPMEPPESGK